MGEYICICCDEKFHLDEPPWDGFEMCDECREENKEVTYSFIGDDNKPYGEFIVVGSHSTGYSWFNEEAADIRHGPFTTEILAYNNAQGYIA